MANTTATPVGTIGTTNPIVPETSMGQPYYDDFDETKGFHRILFRPGRAVQARELTQLQTILQKQIARFGDGIYRNGSMVTGGQITFQGAAEQIGFLNVTTGGANSYTTASQFLHARINSSSNGVATVLITSEITSTQPSLLVIKSASGIKIKSGDTISVVKDYTFSNAVTASVSAVGPATIVSIQKGVYYYNGYFVDVAPQTLILDGYGSIPSYRVGLEFGDSIVDENSDTSLLDPAQEASNYQAPGATRYQITLTLAKRSLTSTDDTRFIELLRVSEGVVQSHITYPTFSEITKTLARRTFDESGNYTVRPFLLTLNDHVASQITGRGAVTAGSGAVAGTGTIFFDEAPINSNIFMNGQSSIVSAVASNTSLTASPVFARGAAANSIILIQDQNKLTVRLSPGKAYIKGYEFERVSPTNLSVKRGRSYDNVTNYNLLSTLGNYILASNVKSVPDISIFEPYDIHVVPAANIVLTSNSSYNSTLIGNTKIRAMEWSSSANTSNGSQTIFKVYLGDVNISNTQYTLNSAMSLVSHLSIVSGALNKVMDIDATGKANNNVFGNTSPVDTNFSILVFPFPQSTIKAGSITNVDYQYRKLQSAISFTTGAATITVSSPDSFVGTGTLSDSTALSAFTVAVRDKGNLPAEFSNGSILPFTSARSRTIAVSPITTAKLTATDLAAYTFTADILHSINITGTAPAPRVKTRAYANTGNVQQTGLGTNISSTNTTIFTTNTVVQIQTNNAIRTVGVPVPLYVSDVINLLKVYEFKETNITQANLSGATDLTSSYVLDNGQRDGLYDHATISLKAGSTAPSGNSRLLMYFDYYSHSGTSGYLTVDSYPNSTTNDGYTSVPSYVSPSTGIVYQLRDCVDWRPVRLNAVEGVSVTTAKILEPGNAFISDFSYYLARIDKIVLSKDSIFKVIQGVSGLYPDPPAIEPDDMLLYTLSIPAFTFKPSDVDIRFNENKRYTMRDIGRLERRIENLEYYTALNLLEKDASSLQILDPAGLNRFKNGIIVDSFTGHSVGDVKSYDYICAMDFVKGVLRPSCNTNNFRFNTSTLDNAVNRGGQITLAYTTRSLIQQNVATGYEIINRFNYVNWAGSLRLFPDNDSWYDLIARPQVLVNIEGENDAWEEAGQVSTTGTAASTSTTVDTRTPFATAYGFWGSGWFGTIHQIANPTATYINQTGVSRSTPNIVDTGRTRSGASIVAPGAIFDSAGEEIVNVSVVPYIRPADILIYSDTLRPSAQYYPFFDGVSVLAYWRNPTILIADIATISNLSSNGTFYSNNFSETVSTADGAVTAVVGDIPRYASMYANKKFPIITVLNANGSFFSGNVITGSIEGATATIQEVIKLSGNCASDNANVILEGPQDTAIWQNTFVNNLIGKPINICKGTGIGQIRIITGYNENTRDVATDTAWTTALDTSSVYSLGLPTASPLGSVVGTLCLPDPSVQSFLTGEKKVRLTTSSNNSQSVIASYADAIYHAAGRIVNITQIPAIRPPVVIAPPTPFTPGGSPVVDPVTEVVTPGRIQQTDPVPEVTPTPPEPEERILWVRYIEGQTNEGEIERNLPPGWRIEWTYGLGN